MNESATSFASPTPISIDIGSLADGVTTHNGNVPSNGVTWYSFVLNGPARDDAGPAGQFCDLDTEGSVTDMAFGLYKTDGTLVATDDDSGSGTNAQLSFGIGRRAAVGDGLQYDGRNYDKNNGSPIPGLDPGRYYIAVAPAGSVFGNSFTVTGGAIGGGYTLNFNTNINSGALAPSVAPAVVQDLGSIVAPGAQFDSVNMDPYAVRWFKFSACLDANDPLSYLDFSAEGTSAPDMIALLFDAAGNLVTSDVDSGGGSTAQLSFGQVSPARPAFGDGNSFAGQNGYLPAGDYYVAISYHLPDIGLAQSPGTNGRWHVRSYSNSAGYVFNGAVYVNWNSCTPSVKLAPSPALVSQREPTVPSNCAPGFQSTMLPLVDEFYLHSGEVFHNAVDLRIKGRGMDFVWARKYGSRTAPDSAQGYGWDFSYNIFLEQSGADLIVHNGWGRADKYVLQPDGSWTCPEFFRRLTANPDGTYILAFSDTSVWNLNPLSDPASGKVSSIVDRNGNTMNFAYDGQGRLVTITDTLSRPIQIGYDAAGSISTVTDFTGRQVRYAYYDGVQPGGSLGDLRSMTSPTVTGTPNGNDFPSGKTTSYTYTTGFADPRLNHNLLSITDARGNTYLTNQFTSVTDPDDLVFDRVFLRRLGDAGDLMSIGYAAVTPAPENNFATQETAVIDRNGNSKELFYDQGNRLVLQRELTRGLHVPEPAAYETRWTYNADSLPTLIEYPNGNSEQYIYDSGNTDPRARENLLMRIRDAGPLGGDQTSITESFEYSTFGGCCGTSFVTRHIDGRGNSVFHEYDLRGNRTRTVNRVATIIEEWEYNGFGQVVKHIHPGNGPDGAGCRRVDTHAYYASGPQMGYMQSATTDASDPLACPGAHFNLTTSFEVDARGNLTAATDPRGCRTDFSVNQLDQVNRQTKPPVNPPADMSRYADDLFYDANNNVVRRDVQNVDDTGTLVASNTHYSTITDFDILNTPTRIARERRTAALALNVLSYAVIPVALRPEFVVTEYGYDRNRNRTLERYGEAVNGNDPFNAMQIQYDERDLKLVVRRAPGAPGPGGQSTVVYDYDGNRNLIQMNEGVESAGHVTTYTYDGYNRRLQTTDPMGNVHLHAYDANGNRGGDRSPGVPNPYAEEIRGELFDVVGSTDNRVLSRTIAVYDPMDRTIRTDVSHFDSDTGINILDGMATAMHEYNGLSKELRTTNDNNHAELTSFDTMNRPVSTTDAKGNTNAVIYDANSNIVAIVSNESPDIENPELPTEVFSTQLQYDCLNRPIRVADSVSNTATTGHDSRGNETVATDPLGRVTRSEFDGLNRLVRTGLDMNNNGSAFESTDIVTARSWDDSSRLRSQTDGNGNGTQYVYDSLNRMIREQYADGTRKDFTFDPHDNRTTSTDANLNVVDFVYDKLHRVTSKDITPGPGVAGATDGGSTFELYRYDGLSRLTRAQDNDSILLRSYDSLSKVVRETLNGKLTDASYDGAGNQTRCTYPSGHVVSRTYDALERLRVVSDGFLPVIAFYEYVGADRVQRRTYPHSRTDYTYDGISGTANPPNDFGVQKIVRTRHINTDNGTVIDDRTFTWDGASNKTQRSDVRAGGARLTHNYLYDPANRLVHTVVTNSVNAVVRDEQLILDNTGNRTTVTGGDNPGEYICVGSLPEPGDCEMNQYTSTPFDHREYTATETSSARLRRARPTGTTRAWLTARISSISSSRSSPERSTSTTTASATARTSSTSSARSSPDVRIRHPQA